MWAFWQLGSKCREVVKSWPSAKGSAWYCFRQPPDNLQTRYNSKKQEINFPFAFRTAKVPSYLHSPIAWNSEGDVPSLFGLPEHATKVPSPTPVGVFRLGREVSENCEIHSLYLCAVHQSRPVCLFIASPIASSTWMCLSDCLKDVEGGILWSWFEGLSRYFLLGF